MAGLKARTRLLILALLILGGATALTYDVWKLDMRLKRDVSVELLHGRHTQAQQILELLGRPFTTLVNFEYTLWDEMYAFVGTPRRSWAKSNIDVLLDTYSLDAIWVCATNGRTVYGINRWQMPELETLALLDLAPRQIFAQTSSVHFFVYSPVGLLEMRGAQIQPSEDNDRRAAPAGYFFAARRWDSAFLQRLGVLVHATPELLPLSAARGATQDVAATTFMSLRDWRGAPLLNLRMTTASPVTQLFDAAIDNHTLHLMLRNAAILLLIIAVTYRYFNRPLAQISLSLERNEPQIVAHLMADTSEFGRIARLITMHARQKEELRAEVQTREQSQKDLQQAKDTAEMINRIVPSAVLTVDAEQRVLTWNKKAEELTGYTAAEIIGQRCTLFTREPCTSCCGLFNPERTAPIVARECAIETKDGRRRTILKNAEMFYDSSGRLSGIESFVDISERKQAETYIEMGREVLQILNEPGDMQNTIPRILATMKMRTGFDAVGIRLQAGDDFPYIAQDGFADDFLLTETSLTARDAQGALLRDADGKISLACICGLVIAGQTDPAQPFFTRGGSFWINDASLLLALPADQDPCCQPRGQCIHHGYVSMALVPIRSEDRIVGLIQLNDRRKGCFTLDMIELLEGSAAHLGAALMRKQAEEARARSEMKFRTLFDANSDAVILQDEQGFLDCNKAALEMFGCATQAAFCAQHFTGDFFPPQQPCGTDSVALARRKIATAMEKGSTRFEWLCKRVDTGKHFSSEIILNPMVLDGKPIILSTVRDITERMRIEEALRVERLQLRTLIDNVPDLIYVKDTESRFVVANEALARISGVADPALLLGRRDGDFFPPELVHHYLADEQRVLHEGVSILNKEEQTGTSADSLRWMSTTKIPLQDAAGSVIGLAGIGRDISARKQAEAYMEMGREVLQILNEPGDLQDAIQRVLATVKTRTGFDAVGIRLRDGDDFPYFAQQGFSKEFLLTENSLVAHTADGGVCRDKDGNISLVCTCGLVIAGKTDPAHPLFTRGGSFWTNDSFPLLDLPPDQDPRYQPRNQCIHCGYASVALVPIRSKDTIVGLIHLDDQRKGCFTLDLVEQLEGIAAHIGAALMRKQAEDALQSKTALLEAQTNATIDGILVVGDNNKRLLINQRMIALFKVPPSVLDDADDTALLTHVISLTKHPDDFLAKVMQLNAHPDEISRDEIEFKSGMVLDRYSAPVLSKEGEHYGRLWIFREITERKQMEQTLYQRDALLQATAHASHILLAERDMDRAISTALETIGRAANQDRAYIFENHVESSSGTRMMSQRYEWAKSGVSAQIDNPELQNLSYDMLSMRWYDELGAGRPIEGCVRDFPESERVILEPQDIVSLLVVPITIEGAFWGFIGFDNCHSAYAWSDSERSILTATAAAIGTAIVQHRARRSLQHRALFGEIMIDIASLFVGTGNADEAIKQALAMVGEFVGADTGSLYLMSGTNDTLAAAHTWQRAQAAPAVAVLSPANLAALVPWTLAELRRQRIVMLPSREQASASARAELAALAAQGITTLLALPIARHKTFAGMLAFSNPARAREWDKSERSLLRVVATLFSNALEKRDIDARLQQSTGELQERVHELNCLHMISTVMNNPRSTLAQMLARATEILPKAWIRADAVGLQVRVGEIVYHTPLYDEHQPGKQWNIRAANATVGTLTAQFLDDSTEDSRFVKEILLEDIAERIGKTVEQMRAMREMHKLSRAIEQAGESIYITDRTGVIEYVNPAFEQMTGYALAEALGHTPRLLRSDLHAADFYAHMHAVLQAGEIYRDVVINRRKDGTPYYQSMTIAPVKDENGVIAHYVACAQDISELKRAEEQLAQARAQEVAIAAKIQQTLLTGHPPASTRELAIAAGTIPSQPVDGDFYDFYQHGTQTLDVVIGDVMGKGISAALLGAATKSLFPQVMQELSATHDRHGAPDVRAIVNAVHREVTPELIALNSFITCCYLRFDLATDHVLMVDCGHTPSIHYQAAHGQCALLKGGNMPLGFSKRETYSQVILPYGVGDVFVLYSDGITEAQNSAGEMFGEERLCALVCAQAADEPAALLGSINAAVAAFSGQAIQRDDLTCIVVRVTATGAQLRHEAQLTIPGDYDALTRARATLQAFLAHVPAAALEDKERDLLLLAFQEALVNIIKHGYADQPAGQIVVTMKAYADALFLELAHHGASFEPKAVASPAFDGSRDQGFGVFIMDACSEVSYGFGSQGSHLTVLRKPFTAFHAAPTCFST